jgi:hypothetical protein
MLSPTLVKRSTLNDAASGVGYQRVRGAESLGECQSTLARTGPFVHAEQRRVYASSGLPKGAVLPSTVILIP